MRNWRNLIHASPTLAIGTLLCELWTFNIFMNIFYTYVIITSPSQVYLYNGDL